MLYPQKRSEFFISDHLQNFKSEPIPDPDFLILPENCRKTAAECNAGKDVPLWELKFRNFGHCKHSLG
jgi:hypothetical protein